MDVHKPRRSLSPQNGCWPRRFSTHKIFISICKKIALIYVTTIVTMITWQTQVNISSSKRGDPKTSWRPYKVSQNLKIWAIVQEQKLTSCQHTWRSTMSHVHWRGQQLSNVKDPKKLLRVDVDRQENNFAAKTKSDCESGAHTEALPWLWEDATGALERILVKMRIDCMIDEQKQKINRKIER